jgi:hypothetical protein
MPEYSISQARRNTASGAQSSWANRSTQSMETINS